MLWIFKGRKPIARIFCVCILQNSSWRINRNELDTLCITSEMDHPGPVPVWLLFSVPRSHLCTRGFSHPNLIAALFPCLCYGHKFLWVSSSAATAQTRFFFYYFIYNSSNQIGFFPLIPIHRASKLHRQMSLLALLYRKAVYILLHCTIAVAVFHCLTFLLNMKTEIEE